MLEDVREAGQVSKTRTSSTPNFDGRSDGRFDLPLVHAKQPLRVDASAVMLVTRAHTEIKSPAHTEIKSLTMARMRERRMLTSRLKRRDCIDVIVWMRLKEFEVDGVI